MKDFTVAVFPMEHSTGFARKYTAYTRYYNPKWPGCCLHTMPANSGMEAKKAAIIEHKEKCVPMEK